MLVFLRQDFIRGRATGEAAAHDPLLGLMSTPQKEFWHRNDRGESCFNCSSLSIKRIH